MTFASTKPSNHMSWLEEQDAVKASGNQLIFHYPFCSEHQVKVKAMISSSNKKRKAMGDLVVDRDTNHRQNLAMSLDDDDDDFYSTDYNAVSFVQM